MRRYFSPRGPEAFFSASDISRYTIIFEIYIIILENTRYKKEKKMEANSRNTKLRENLELPKNVEMITKRPKARSHWMTYGKCI